jgi:hypothetical protein
MPATRPIRHDHFIAVLLSLKKGVQGIWISSFLTEPGEAEKLQAYREGLDNRTRRQATSRSHSDEAVLG